MENSRKAIISTHTINLQEQLIHKDIPIVRQLVPWKFQAELLKGRSNYLCPRRLERAFRSTPDLFTSSEQAEMQQIWEWSQKTRDGTLSDLDFTPSSKIWAQVCSEGHVCTLKSCGGSNSGCFYQAARRRAADAHVLIINHSLFFSLLSSLEELLPEDANFLFPRDFLIMDEVCEEAKKAGDAANNEQTRQELHDLASRFEAFHSSLTAFLDQSEDGHVYWVERSGGDSKALTLQSAPVDVSEQLNRVFFTRDRPCVLTSATLSAGETENLGYFRRRVGAEDVAAARIDSPFDYQRQMRLYVVRNIPPPGTKDHDAALPKWIEHFLELSQGRAFVLFTSYTLMNTVADRLEPFCDKKGWQMLVQGRSLPRHEMLAEFKNDTHSVLFGTESFWTGVDVPGDALSNVIITKLPFAVPDSPLTAARLEYIEENGGNSFAEYSVPEAILKLRQGVGRLIRTKRDKGICAILDNRVVTKPYGRTFLHALPACPMEVL
jgi:Rad3-related DNA helicase